MRAPRVRTRTARSRSSWAGGLEPVRVTGATGSSGGGRRRAGPRPPAARAGAPHPRRRGPIAGRDRLGWALPYGRSPRRTSRPAAPPPPTPWPPGPGQLVRVGEGGARAEPECGRAKGRRGARRAACRLDTAAGAAVAPERHLRVADGRKTGHTICSHCTGSSPAFTLFPRPPVESAIFRCRAR